MTNKSVFSRNLQSYMDLNQKTRRDVCADLGFNYSTFTDWVRGQKYPRIDKIQKLADYFGIQKSDLIEDKLPAEQKTGDDVLANIIVRMKMDTVFRQSVEALSALDDATLKGANAMLQAIPKHRKDEVK